MTADNFERSIALVLGYEGGFVDDPRDKGGATNRGITLATLSRWRGRPVSKAEVQALTEAEAKRIYRALYWSRIRGDDLPSGVDLACLDFCVNSGEFRAAKYLQTIVGVPADGDIGPKTLAAIGKLDPAFVIRELCKRRLTFLQGLSTWKTYGKGWKRRVLAVETEALAMAGAASAPPPPDIEPVPPSTQPATSGGLFCNAVRKILRRPA